MPLLWVLRDELGLTGTKYGCGIGICGSCNVLVDGVSTRSCSISVGDVAGDVTTI
jgi:isoquinoline 1-oxidoreductase alpha subunit